MPIAELEELVAYQRFIARHDLLPSGGMPQNLDYLRGIFNDHSYIGDKVPRLIVEAVEVYRRVTHVFGPLSSTGFARANQLADRQQLLRERGVQHVHTLLERRLERQAESPMHAPKPSALDRQKLVTAIEARMALAAEQIEAARVRDDVSSREGWACQREGLEIARNMILSGGFDL